MLTYINEAMVDLLNEHTRSKIAEELQVSTAMISIWLQKDNDFCPRINVAKRLYDVYNIVVYPYSEEALKAYTPYETL
jgi:hypothetical protein